MLIPTRAGHEQDKAVGLQADSGVATFELMRRLEDAERSRLATAVEQAAEGVFLLALDKTITYANPAARELYGLDARDLIGRKMNVFGSGQHSGRFWAELWAPVGLRYHATHHLLPSLPYHALPEAHRRLAGRFGEGATYHDATYPGLWLLIGRIARSTMSHREPRTIAWKAGEA